MVYVYIWLHIFRADFEFPHCPYIIVSFPREAQYERVVKNVPFGVTYAIYNLLPLEF